MAFTSFNGVSDAARAIQDFLYDRDAAIPDELRTKLRNLVGPTTSPVDAVVQGAELIYARKADLDPDLLCLGAGLALIAQQYNFHSLAENDRGSKMALAMMRDGNIEQPTGMTYPDVENDPEPKPEFSAETPEAPLELKEPVSQVTNITDEAAVIPAGEGARRVGRRRRRQA